MDSLKALIEALIFSAEAPLTKKQIKALLPDTDEEALEKTLQELVSDYKGKRGFYLREVAGGFQFCTHQEYAPWIRRLKGNKPAAFSRAAMETLVIIAYRQPTNKGEIDRIRGVDSGATLKSLLGKKVIRIVGRLDEPGKPMLYGTTKKFLEVFGLKDISELPTLQEMRELEDAQE